MARNTNIATAVSFSLDRTFAFATGAIVGDLCAKENAKGLSEQLWSGLKDRKVSSFADELRDTYDECIGYMLASSDADTKRQGKLVAGWKKGSVFAARLSDCRTIAKFCDSHADQAGEVWSKETLKLALDFVRAALKAEKPTKEPVTGETVPAEIVVEANAEAGALILADLRAYLAAASEADKLAVLCELESIING